MSLPVASSPPPPEDPSQAADRLARLERLSAILGESLTPRRLAEVVLDEISAALPATTAAIWEIPDERPHQAELLSQRGWGPEHHLVFQVIPLGAPNPVGQVLRTGVEQWVYDREELGSRFKEVGELGLALDRGERAVAALALKSDGRVIGAIAVGFAGHDSLNQSAHWFLHTLASLCAQALRRGRLFEDLLASHGIALDARASARETARRAAERMTLLARVGDTLAATLDYEGTLRNAIGICLPELADFGFFDVREGDPVRRVALAHGDPQRQALLDQTRWVRSERTDVNLCALSTGAPALHPHLDEPWLRNVAVNEGHYQLMRQLRMGSMITVPLSYGGELLGALTLFRNADGPPFDEGDLATAQDVARRAAMAVVNARLLRDAQAAIAARDDFLAVASHELRTPITSAKLYLQVSIRDLDRGALDRDKELARLRRSTAQLDRLGALVSQLLDVGRLSAGRLTLEPEQVDLSVLAEEVLGRFEHDLGVVGARLSLAPPGQVVGSWDRSRLDQVVTNLISNALKYGAGKPIAVVVEVVGGVARLMVKDGGVGIAPADHSRIFDRFERAAPTRKVAGIGLGLWIVKQLVELHRGRVAVESAPGQGSAFTVELPL